MSHEFKNVGFLLDKSQYKWNEILYESGKNEDSPRFEQIICEYSNFTT